MAQSVRRRRWPVYTIAALVVLALLWVGGWFAAARFVEAGLARVTSGPIGGYTIGCPEPIVFGFPLRIDIRCQRVTVSGQGNTLAASIGGMSASAPLYRPGSVEATLDAPLKLDMAPRGLAITATWSAARADASAWLDGLSSGSAHFETLALDNAGQPSSLPVTNVKARSADIGIAPAGSGNYRITANVDGLALTRTDGGPFPQLDTSASIMAEGVGALGTNPAATLGAWLKQGGRLQIDNLRIAAAGAVLLVSGAVTLSVDGYINGPIVLSYNNIEAFGRFIDALRPGTSAKNAGNLQTLDKATRTISTPEGNFHQTALLAIDGRLLFLGIIPLPLDQIPPIRF